MNTLLSSADVIELVNTEYAELGETHHCMLLRRGFNDSYLVGIGRQWYVFRVYLNNKYYIESSDAFQFELDLLDHLNHAGIPVSCAVKRDNQKKLGVAPTPQGDRAFALFTYAKGDQLRKKTATLERCFLIGKTTAELHLAANSFSSEHSRYHLDRKYLVDEPLKTIAQQADEATRTVSERRAKEMEEMVESMQPVEELLETIHSLDVSGDEYGIIHSDLHLGNLHLNGDQITIFDFDHCAYGWRAYELAVTEFLPNNLSSEILKGYESVRPLSQGERECIPVFAKLRRLWDIGDSLAVDSISAESDD